MRTHSADSIEWPAGDTAARVLGASPRRRGPIARLILSALAQVYGGVVRLRNLAYDRQLLRTRRVGIPVISIGNIVAGGAGKTPFTRWLAGEVMGRGRNVAILHGGYGADEPALHRHWQSGAIVFDKRDRSAAAQEAAAAGADVIILDDAFQHRRLERDLDIVLLPIESTSTRLLPRGPLREPESALGRADLIVVTRKTQPAEAARALAGRLRRSLGKPCAVAAVLPGEIVHAGKGQMTRPAEFAVVTAVARPDLLRAQLDAFGVRVVRMLAYPDHHEYSARDVAYILRTAGALPILTTEKDAMKLLQLVEHDRLWIIEQRVAIEEGMDAITAIIERVL